MSFLFRDFIGLRFPVVSAAVAAVFALCLTSVADPVKDQAFDPAPLEATVAEVASRLSARIGVTVLDRWGNVLWSVRGDERFPLNSTFKAFLCADLLNQIEAGRLIADAQVRITAGDLVAHSPVTKRRVGGSPMTLVELCGAAMMLSDITAANLILKAVGGPAALTSFLRETGDPVTRIDRFETELNEGTPGDPRDTTTPKAAAATLVRLAFGTSLREGARDTLIDWLIGNQVGGSLLRAGLPAGWKIGDRTGAGGHGSRSTIAIIWPPVSGPVVVAIYLTQTDAGFVVRNKAISEIGAALAMALDRRSDSLGVSPARP
ncbi:class A beta-lactamase [Roseibium sp.]|uniref:class A beta-lactamase n=1 Tax=Roseibium sp. TaxID=1936156 RepID=UPI003A9749A9